MTTLKTVRVPPQYSEAFARAEDIVSAYFRARHDAPEHGTIEVFGQRYVLVRAASLSVEFFSLVRELYGADREAEADLFSRNLLYDLAHAIGKSDARELHAQMGLVDPIARLSAGPVHFAHAGWASVDILPESVPSADDDYFVVYDHPYAFESDAWMRAGQPTEFPVCVMNAAYSSGWCAQSFGLELVSSEVLCRARGDDRCRFVMAPPHRIEAALERYARHADVPPRARSYQIPDFFARKRVEEELRQSRAELERRVAERTRELEEANARLRREMEERSRVEEELRRTQKLDAVGRLAAGVAHDFNNLMSVVLHRSALVAGRLGSDDPSRADLDDVTRAAERGAQLTRSLIAFSRGRVLTRSSLDLNALVAEVARLLRPLVDARITFDTRLARDVPRVEADPVQLEQALTNLVMNARDAMPSGGALTVETSAVDVTAPEGDALSPGRYATVTVRDTGVGMDEATRARVFEPFFTTKPHGSGLGLLTVYGVARQCGGRVTVESAPGQGSRFVLWLPQASAPTPTPVPTRPPPEAALRGDERLLLVEDQDAVRNSLRAILARFGYTVLEARDGRAALELSRAHPPVDLVITDVVMPHMGGRELAEHLTAARPTLPVIFMSGYAEDLPADARDGPRRAFLQKPFAPDALLRTMRDLLANLP